MSPRFGPLLAALGPGVLLPHRAVVVEGGHQSFLPVRDPEIA
jgi:hypothetical protein